MQLSYYYTNPVSLFLFQVSTQNTRPIPIPSSIFDPRWDQD